MGTGMRDPGRETGALRAQRGEAQDMEHQEGTFDEERETCPGLKATQKPSRNYE